jgi:cobalt-zinc-cadmium efflux system protein
MKDAQRAAQQTAQQAAYLHAHKKGDAEYLHYRESHQTGILLAALLLTFFYAGIEAFAGFWANSLALISDAGHMVADASALALALLAQIIAKRPPSVKNSFGFGRAESLAAFVNCLAMIVLIIWIATEAISRFNHPHQVQGQIVMVVAVIGLLINVIVAWILSKDKKSVNTRAALVHVMGDLLGSLAALTAGVVIHFTGWMQIDPILSLFVCVLLIRSTLTILKESYHFLMEGVPHHINYVQVGKDLQAIDGVLAVHDLHVWEMSPGHPALIGHVEVRDMQDWPITMEKINTMLLEKHEIDHVTLQPEIPS